LVPALGTFFLHLFCTVFDVVHVCTFSLPGLDGIQHAELAH